MLILDMRNVPEGEKVKELNLKYEGVGKR